MIRTMNQDDDGSDGRPPLPQSPTGRPGPRPLPPDPSQYDTERNALARARGLAAPYIAGGEDADAEASRRESRIYGRLLILMILLIVGTSIALTIIAIALGYVGFDSR
jgi:hypothetical protein